MAKLPIDDILKAIGKQLGNKGNQRVRYELMKKTKSIPTSGSSAITAKPKVKPKAKPKAKPKVKPKGRKSVTITGREVGKIARTTPARPRRDYYPKGKTVAQTDSEKRAAERLANRMLRQSGDSVRPSKPSGNAKPVDVRGSIIQPPSKATMRPAKPSKSSFEADKFKGEIKADRARFGRGQKPPKPKEGGSGVKAKPKPKKPSGSGGAAASVGRKQPYVPNTKEAVKARRAASAISDKQKMTNEIKRIRENIAKAKTPADRAKFQQQLTNFVIKTASDRAVGKGKYAGTRPLRNR